MSDQNDTRRIEAQQFGHFRLTQESRSRHGVFDAMREREISRRTPGAAVVEVENIPSGAADILCQIQISFVTGKTVQQDHRRMRAGARGDIHECIQQRSVARNLKSLHGSSIGSIAGRRLCFERVLRAHATQNGNRNQVPKRRFRFGGKWSHGSYFRIENPA